MTQLILQLFANFIHNFDLRFVIYFDLIFKNIRSFINI